MESYRFLFDIGIILLSTKIFGILTRAMRLPQVVGALFAGILLGPVALNLIHSEGFIKPLAELGVVVLMFEAGLETDINELKKTGKASFIIALLGVLIPLIFGFGLAYFYHGSELFAADSRNILQSVFLGIILTATSVSISVEVLKEMGKLSTKAGNTILGAALIDDILGIVGLTVVISMASKDVNLAVVLLKIVAFLVFAVIVGYFGHKLFDKWVNRYNKDLRRFVVTSFAFCLILSYIAEHYFGVSDITGAFVAGLVVSNTSRTHYISKRFETSSYMLLSPMFFASIGIGLTITAMSLDVIIFTVLLTIVAILTKVVGCGIGAKVSGYTTKESIQIGTGMISRGEVALIVASKGLPLGLIEPATLGPIIIMIVITTVITPIMLKFVFKEKVDLKVV